MGAILELVDVRKDFIKNDTVFTALENVNIDFPEHSFISIVGPSGCGKTTILRMCVGLLEATSGQVLFHGKPLKGIHGQIGYVTQDHNLYPWMTLLDNVSFPLEARGVSREERYSRAREVIKMVGLEGFEHSYPVQLSGGMQKRGSIVRTLVYDPDVIMMDEPFGALDAQTRMILQQELLDLWSKRRKTIIFITHDLAEAISLSDRVIVMGKNPGRVMQVYDVPLPRPRDVFSIQETDEFHETYQQIWRHFKDEMRSRKI